MSDTDPVIVSTDRRGVASVVLNRPSSRNALSRDMIDRLSDVAMDIARERDIRAVCLTGRGGYFCAGGDLEWMRTQFNASNDKRRLEARALALMLDRWRRLPVFVLAAVSSGALGGGAGLICVADSVIAEEGTRFGFPEVRLGLIPATIAPHVIARIGAARAQRAFITGRRFGAEEAREMALVSRTVPVGGLAAAVEEEIGDCLASAPGAVAAAKAQIHAIARDARHGEIAVTIEELVERWRSDEAQEGVGAFFDRRAPNWVIKG